MRRTASQPAIGSVRHGSISRRANCMRRRALINSGTVLVRVFVSRGAVSEIARPAGPTLSNCTVLRPILYTRTARGRSDATCSGVNTDASTAVPRHHHDHHHQQQQHSSASIVLCDVYNYDSASIPLRVDNSRPGLLRSLPLSAVAADGDSFVRPSLCPRP